MDTLKKALPILVILTLTLLHLQAKEENGLRVEVQKSTLSKDDSRKDGYLDTVDRTLGLKVFIKNISMKDLEPGKIDWIMIVERWGSGPSRFERYKGSEPLPALRTGQELTLTVGESQISGYKGYGGTYQDKIEGWGVNVSHPNKAPMTITSSSSFERLNAKAKDAVKE